MIVIDELRMSSEFCRNLVKNYCEPVYRGRKKSEKQKKRGKKSSRKEKSKKKARLHKKREGVSDPALLYNTFVRARSNSPQRRRRLPSESNPMAHVGMAQLRPRQDAVAHDFTGPDSSSTALTHQEQTSNLASSRRPKDGRTSSSSAGSSWASLHADDFGFVLDGNEVCACLSQVSQDSARTGCRDAAAASTSGSASCSGRASTTTPPSAEETAMKLRPATLPARLVPVDERHPPSPCFDFAPEQSDHGPQSHNTQPDDQPSGCWARSRCAVPRPRLFNE